MIRKYEQNIESKDIVVELHENVLIIKILTSNICMIRKNMITYQNHNSRVFFLQSIRDIFLKNKFKLLYLLFICFNFFFSFLWFLVRELVERFFKHYKLKFFFFENFATFYQNSFNFLIQIKKEIEFSKKLFNAILLNNSITLLIIFNKEFILKFHLIEFRKRF